MIKYTSISFPPKKGMFGTQLLFISNIGIKWASGPKVSTFGHSRVSVKAQILLEAEGEKCCVAYKGSSRRLTADFPTETQMSGGSETTYAKC